ncbi:MAG: DUF523 domain-containing protein [Proteobacteria bacterium]|nr:DUF523 domain-containing protein [Pseudomonadota bacterium]
MNTPITIGISACLLGKNTRYDGGNLHAPLLVETLNQSATLIPLCPEAECGLGVPREPMRLEGDPENPRLMTVTTRSDLTDRMQDWCTRRLDTLSGQPLYGMILKARSPSCGKRVAVHGAEGRELAYSPGLFAGMVMERFPALPVADEEELRDSSLLADFIARITLKQQSKPENQR